MGDFLYFFIFIVANLNWNINFIVLNFNFYLYLFFNYFVVGVVGFVVYLHCALCVKCEDGFRRQATAFYWIYCIVHCIPARISNKSQDFSWLTRPGLKKNYPIYFLLLHIRGQRAGCSHNMCIEVSSSSIFNFPHIFYDLGSKLLLVGFGFG